jgi:hypothetical protein
MTKLELNKFLKELTELTKRYDIGIGGCGCCGSPYIIDLKGGTLIGEHLSWDEETNSYNIYSELPELDF